LIEILVNLPEGGEPVSLVQYVEYVVDGGLHGDDAQVPDYLQFDTPDWGVEAVTDKLP